MFGPIDYNVGTKISSYSAIKEENNVKEGE